MDYKKMVATPIEVTTIGPSNAPIYGCGITKAHPDLVALQRYETFLK